MVCWWIGSVASTAVAAELTVRQERTVQVASIATAYGFAGLHSVLLADAYGRGRAVSRSWVPGIAMSSVSVVGLAVGHAVLGAGFSQGPDEALTFGLAAPSGLLLGGLLLGGAVDGGRRGEGGVWMDRGPAAVTLVQGLTVAASGIALSLASNLAESDLSKLAPIYTWAATGTVLTGYAVASLAGRHRGRRAR